MDRADGQNEAPDSGLRPAAPTLLGLPPEMRNEIFSYLSQTYSLPRYLDAKTRWSGLQWVACSPTIFREVAAPLYRTRCFYFAANPKRRMPLKPVVHSLREHLLLTFATAKTSWPASFGLQWFSEILLDLRISDMEAHQLDGLLSYLRFACAGLEECKGLRRIYIYVAPHYMFYDPGIVDRRHQFWRLADVGFSHEKAIVRELVLRVQQALEKLMPAGCEVFWDLSENQIVDRRAKDGSVLWCSFPD